MSDEIELTLEVGKRYKTRIGLTTSPVRFNENCGTNYKWEAEVDEFPGHGLSVLAWKGNGRFLTNSVDSDKDLVELIAEDELIECPDCEGEGEVATTSPSACSSSIDECCGGCFGEVKCETYNGTGLIDKEEE